MRIDDSFAASSELQSTQIARQEQTRQEQVPQERESDPREDSVSLSNLGSELARAIETETDDVVNAINEVQQAVNDGSFNVPADEIAEGLIDDALTGSAAGRGPSGPE